MIFKNKKILFGIILGVSLLTHFAYFGQPNQTVFDEVHFGKFVSGYLAGEYFFDIHPPLGKLLFYSAATLGGFGPEFAFDNIGTAFPNKHYIVLRFLPTLAGALLPLVIFGIALKLRFSPAVSFVISILIALDSALIIQSRFILMDAFLLLFGFLALFFYLQYREKPKERGSLRYLWWAGIFGALSGSIKWTGFGFLGFIILLELFRTTPNFELLKFWRKLRWPSLLPISALVIVPFLIYFATFAAHFKLLPKSGPGDAFMSVRFQKTLRGSPHQNNPDFKPVGLLKKFSELNLQMYSANQGLTAAHPYGSKWYTWPFLSRPIYFWNKAEPPSTTGEFTERKIYLLGNPIIWWTSTAAILYLIFNLLVNLWKRKGSDERIYWIVGAYFLNLLPFIGVQRVLFLYHYFPALIFAILGLGYVINQQKKPLTTLAILAGMATFLFLYFAPLTYGLPLTARESTGFFWFPSWR